LAPLNVFSQQPIDGDGEIINSDDGGNFPFFISQYNSYPACYEYFALNRY